MKKITVLAIICLYSLTAPGLALADPSSQNYVIQDYTVGGIGSDSDMSSSSFRLYSTGADSGASQSGSQSFASMPGLLMALQANTPSTPTLQNPTDYYDRLRFILDPGADPETYVYAIAISKDNFVTTQYISKDLTVVDVIDADDWQSFDAWGGEEGLVVTGLEADTEYKIKIKSSQGEFTESDFSPEASASTSLPHLTFSVNGDANMGVWSENNNYSSTAVSTLTTSTNAYHGYSIYAFATQPLTRQNGSETIANISGTYASPIAWLSGLGFGYTTNDTSIAGSPKWNQNPCPGDDGPPLCYAAFNHSGPGDIVADHEEVLGEETIIDETFSLTYKAVTQATQTAGTYTTSIVYTVVPTY